MVQQFRSSLAAREERDATPVDICRRSLSVEDQDLDKGRDLLRWLAR